jgi:hypothetical protein
MIGWKEAVVTYFRVISYINQKGLRKEAGFLSQNGRCPGVTGWRHVVFVRNIKPTVRGTSWLQPH